MTNLQKLPDLVLEMILSYCRCDKFLYSKRDTPIIKLSETSKFLKNLIETNPRLMEKLTLKLPYQKEDHLENAERITEICLDSTRKYSSVEIQCGGADASETDKAKVEILRKSLLAKHADAIKEVEICFNSVGSNVVRGFFYYLENLLNVKEVCIKFMDYTSGMDNDLDSNELINEERQSLPDVGSFSNKFHNLKHLKIETEYGVFVPFFDEFYRISFENHVFCKKFEILLEVLTVSDINLTTFHLEFHPIEFDLDLLLNFLKSQKNLEELKINGIADRTFIGKLGNHIGDLVKLRKIDLHFAGGPIFHDQRAFEWNSKSLEEFRFSIWSRNEDMNYIPKITHLCASEKFKKATFSYDLEFADGFFKNLAMVYQNLTELNVDCSGSNHSSNDIFWIMKFLKKLKVLHFVFPKKSQLDPELFNDNEDLSLPDIEDVGFIFNYSISIDHLSKFFKQMKNLSKFCFQFFEFYNEEYLDRITKELPNLVHLVIEKSIFAGISLDYNSTILMKMQSNIQEFNKNPAHLFRQNKKDIDYWLEEAAKPNAPDKFVNFQDWMRRRAENSEEVAVIDSTLSESSLNLLKLPEHILEKIFAFCSESEVIQKKNLLNLTECCKFLKQFIETNSFLMEKITLKLPNDHTILKKDVETKMNVHLHSGRKYTSADIQFGSYSFYSSEFFEERDQINGRVLLDKHSDTIKKIDIYIESLLVNASSVYVILEYLKNLVKLEYAEVAIIVLGADSDDEEEFEDTEVFTIPDHDSFPNPFTQLKHLKIQIDSEMVSYIFRECKTIEILELVSLGSEEVDYSYLLTLLKNSRDTLHTLILSFEEAFESEEVDVIKRILEMLITAEIDLKVFQLNSDPIRINLIVSELLKFLKTQTNLVELELYNINDKDFFNKAENVLKRLKNLKILDIFFDTRDSDYENEGEDNHRYVLEQLEWRSCSFETIKISNSHLSTIDLKIPKIKFNNEKLKQIEIFGNLKLCDNFFEDICNCQNLVGLRVRNTSNYSSNDIILILKYLKKLKYLTFLFPKDSELDLDLFFNNGNLILPEIDDVTFIFNEKISIGTATKLIQCMTKVTKFCFEYLKNANNEYLDCITRELSNLIHLSNEYDLMSTADSLFSRHFVPLDFEILQKIKTNVRRFNKHSRQFRINGKDIDSLLEESSTSLKTSK